MILSERYREALGFAFDLHKEQTRQGSGVPYVAHLVGVSSLALEYGADEDEAIAALLHDAVEDQGGSETLGRIKSRFGERVGSIVAGCTDAVDPPKPPWRERKEKYLEHLRTADRSVQLVSACDKLYNARAIVSDYRKIGESLWSRFPVDAMACFGTTRRWLGCSLPTWGPLRSSGGRSRKWSGCQVVRGRSESSRGTVQDGNGLLARAVMSSAAAQPSSTATAT
jgi:hypothetical protein